jgi:hypothetical protein
VNTVLAIASIVTAVGYIGCALAAMPTRAWTIPVQKAAIALAALTCVLDLLTRAWFGGAIFAILVVSAVFTLSAKRSTLRLRESLRRWTDA